MRRLLQVAVVALFVATVSTAVRADILAQHTGNANPTDEGWTRDLGTAGNAIDDGGTAAWEINAGKTRYVADISSQVALLESSTWEYTGMLNDAVTPFGAATCGIYMELSYGSDAAAKSYAIAIGSRMEPVANEVMAGQITNISTGAIVGAMNVGAYGAGYHTYKIAKESATSDQVKFYVDGGWQATFGPATGAGTISGLNRFVWGASALLDTDNADARWSAVTLQTAVPEPSTMALLVTGALGLIAYAWRKRR